MSSTTALTKQYDPSDVEPRWLRTWLEHGYYHADEHSPTVPFSITLPPPNVTGSLHMGHALGSTLQDILIRWRRMQGFNAMWMPGTDHASIAVHVLLEKELKRREGRTRQELGREAFLQRAWAWRERSGSRISEQEKVMGFSLDWQRERFTMDDASNRAVREAFVRLHDEGLIYRAIADDQLGPGERDRGERSRGRPPSRERPPVGAALPAGRRRRPPRRGRHHPPGDHARRHRGRGPPRRRPLPRPGRPGGRAAAHRPAHPDRRRHLRRARVRDGRREGHPAHDFNDHECAQRTGLPALQVIDARGRMCAPAPDRYVGLTVDEARKAVVADLDALGLPGHDQGPQGAARPLPALGRGDRADADGAVVRQDPAPGRAGDGGGGERQDPLRPRAVDQDLLHWMTNIRDWCISRQLWWGHRIPAWYCDACDHVTGRVDPRPAPAAAAPACARTTTSSTPGSRSALWPFSTLGWPERAAPSPPSIPTTSWSPLSTSSSSGSRA
ncbi:MAG: class I tRNA ligase family protein [Kofleriaceae bacterium]|nr:class I tRNA ligase family protein [Kofleriaceae bacterium]